MEYGEGGSVGGREGGREIRARQAGGAGGGGRREGREGRTGGRETPMLSDRHGYTEACQWTELLAFTLY